jgi:uracil permease
VIDLRYSLDEKPPVARNFLYAVQWLLIVLPLVTITSNLMAGFLGMNAFQSAALFQRLLLVTGAVTVVQCLLGHRYPLLDGPSAALLLSVAVLGEQGLEVIAGGMLAGGVVLVLLGSFKVVDRLQPLFTDLIVGVVLLLISTTLLPFLYPMIIGVSSRAPYGDPRVLVIAILIMLAIIVISHWGKGLLMNLSIFIGIVTGYAVMAGIGMVDIAPLGQLSWFALPEPLFANGMRFTVPAVLSFLLAYLAVLINGLGSYYSVAEVVGKNALQRRIERGVALTGVGGMMAAALGALGTVSYSLSPGVILVTRVGSRFPVILCGFLMISLAFCQKMAAVLASVPNAVVGAALLVTLAAQMGVGISVILGENKTLDARDYLVVGLPILIGTTASMMSKEFLQLFPAPTRALVGNGLIVGIVAVLLLEHVILRIPDSKFQIPKNNSKAGE